MAKKLKNNVHVHTEDGVKVYGPDDKVPAEHAKLITNKKAWAEDDGSDEPSVEDNEDSAPPPSRGPGK